MNEGRVPAEQAQHVRSAVEERALWASQGAASTPFGLVFGALGGRGLRIEIDCDWKRKVVRKGSAHDRCGGAGQAAPAGF